VCIVLLLIPNNLSYMSCMNVITDGSLCVYPSSLSKYLMVSMILSASWVRPSLALAEDRYADDLGFLLVNFV
jgi:hypothetical protein